MDKYSEDEMDNEDWRATFQHDSPEKGDLSLNDSPTGLVEKCRSEDKISPSRSHTSSARCTHHRVIIHIDIDCFYAQVEMLADPSLRGKPVGVRQKYVVVTSNYEARARGVGKLCAVTDAVRACPDLVLVCGEDLAKYREMSARITAFFHKFTPLVERLGFDENYLDVTEMLDVSPWTRYLGRGVRGHVYGDDSQAPHSPCPCCARLALGSHIAAEIRAQLHADLGVTCSAGVASNKLTAKLVSGTHKPDQQTTLCPGRVDGLMLGLGAVRKIPGIGSSMARRLHSLGVITVQQLRDLPLATLSTEFDASTAAWLTAVAHGKDDAAVKPSAPPQSMSDEDSFRRCSSLGDAKVKMDGLLDSLLTRLQADGRTPGVLRVSVRRVIGDERRRESRQAPIPPHSFRGDETATKSALLDLAVKLFERAVDVTKPFHITVINVCLTKFSDGGDTASDGKSSSIKKYFQSPSTSGNSNHPERHGKRDSVGNIKDMNQEKDSAKRSIKDFFGRSPQTKGKTLEEPDSKRHCAVSVNITGKCHSGNDMSELPVSKESTSEADKASSSCDKLPVVDTRLDEFELPSGVDPTVFQDLPKDIQLEVLSQLNKDSISRTDSNHQTVSCSPRSSAASPQERKNLSHCHPLDSSANPHSTCLCRPPDIDPDVFSALPEDIQRELSNQWTAKDSKVSGKAKTSGVRKTSSIEHFFKR